MNTKKVVAGLLAGVAAGAILSLLFTEKGSKIRKRMYKKGNDTADNLKQRFNEFVDRVEERIGSKA